MYNKLLKHLGLFGILFMLIQLMKFGMFIVTNGYGMDYSVNEVRLDSILILGVAYLSYLWCIVKEKVVDGHKLHNIVGGLLVGLGRCITLIGPIYYIIKQYLMRADIWFGIILIGLIIFVYILMCIDYRREYERIINLEIYVFLVVAAIVINAFSSNRLSLLGIGFITVIGALSRNQASIDYLLERIQKNTPMVTGIRKSNLRRVLLLTLFLVVAYAFRNVVAGILRMLGHGFIYVLAAIIRFLFKSNEEIPLEVGGAAAIGLIGAPVPEGQGTWFKIICYILLAAFCIWRRKEIWNFVKCAYIGCIKRIKVILKWLNTALFHVEKKKVESTFYYTEQIEEINTLEKGMHSKKRKLSKRKIVDELKEAGKILDVNLRYRQKYKILIQLLAWREVPILKSHTPRQICEEALNSNLKLDLTQETEGYENVKYGEMLAAEEAEQVMNLHLNQILGSKG